MAFAHQVGGHADTILASPLSSSTLIKPASERELAFYQSLGPSLAGGDFVQTWTPAFYGTLKAHAPPAAAAAAAATPGAPASTPAPPDMLVLENLTHRFQRPNVLDIKLGTQLYDEDASDEKRERMQRASEASTSGTTGIRLTGFQVWNHATQTYVQTEKAFGKSLAVDELDLGLARFFHPSQSRLSRAEQAALSAPAPAPAPAAEDAPIASTSAAPIPASAPTSTTSSSPPSPLDSPSSTTPASLPLDLLLPVLRTLVRRLNQLIHVWQTLEIRMRGGSLLVVVEGDPDALERAILRSSTSSSSGDDPAHSSQQQGDGGNAEDDDDDNDDAESVSTTDEEGNAKPETLLPLEMRLIDFAHTRSAVGEGPDEGVLLGLRTVQSLLEALTAKLEEQQRQED
ncbi:SAICAR synthase-like protein, partial [Rhodotorula sp. JG-1b]